MSTMLVPVSELEHESTDLAGRLAELAIEDVRAAAPRTLAFSLESATEIARVAGDFLRRVDTLCDPVRDAAHKAWKAAVKQQTDLRAPAEGVERTAKALMAACHGELERRRKEAEAAVQAERERLQREEDARVAAETQRRQAEEEERRLAEAAALEARGDHAAAEHLISAPVEVAPVAPRAVFVAPPEVKAPQLAGTSFSATYGAEVTDLMALVKAVAKGEQPITYLMANMTALNGVARAQKQAMRIPGVSLTEAARVAVRKGA